MRVLGRLLFAVAVLLLGAAAAHAQITYRSSATATSAGMVFVSAGALATDSGACSQVINPAIPAGNNNDLLVAVVLDRDGGTLVQSGSAWNLMFTADQPTHRARIYWRLAAGGDTLTVTKTVTCTNALVGAVARFRGVDTATPFMGGGTGTTVSQYQTANTTVGNTTGTINATVANSMALFAATLSDDNAITAPANFNPAFYYSTTTGNDGAIGLYYKKETTTGNKGPYTATQAAIDPSHGVLALIRPDPGSLTINLPAGTVDGDVMIASIAVRPCSITSGAACTTTVTAPAGWTLIGTQDQTTGGINASFGSRLFTYYRVAASDAGPYTWTIAGNPAQAGAAGGISSYINVDNTNPIVASASSATASGANHIAPTVNSGTVTFTRLVTVHMVNSAGTLSQPAGMTERYDVASLPAGNASGLTLSQDDEARAAAGATGTRTAAFTGTVDTGATFSILLRSTDTNFEVVNGSHTVNCAATPMVVTIIARSPDGSVNTSYTGTINFTTSTGNGNWALVAGTPANFNNGAANDGAATYTFAAADLGIASFNLTNTAATALTVTVQDAGTTLSATSSTITFVADGYRLVPDPLQIAGKPQAWSVQHLVACAASTASGHGANNPVKMWLTLDGAHPGAATLPGATGTALVSPLPTAEPGANNITLAFAGGIAPFTLSTTDVGKYIINIRDTNTTIRGTSAPVTVRPFALGFTATRGTDHTSAVLGAAGDNFSATVTGYQWQGADDLNNDGVPDAGADLTAGNGTTARFAWDVTVAPTLNTAGVAGAISRGVACDQPGTIAQASFAAGAAAITDWCYSEVGNVFLTATAANYLNSPGVNVTGNTGNNGAASDYIGRFRPKQFGLSASTLTNRLAAACGVASTFSYMNETLGLAFTLTAQNTQGATTQNYTGLYAKLGLTTFANFNLGARSGTTNYTTRLDSGIAPTGTWTNGVAPVSMTTGIRRANPDAPDGPITAIGFGIRPVDSDTVAMSTFDFDVDNNTVNESKSLGVTTEARFGRLRLLGAAGSEQAALTLPVQTEYWNGGNFVVNTSDNCTLLDRSNIALVFPTTIIPPEVVPRLVSCETSVSATTVPFTAGIGTLKLSAPGKGNTGSVTVTPQLSGASGSYCNGVGGGGLFIPVVSANRSYLLGNWNAADPDSNANTSYDDNPSVRGSFGVYGSQPNNIIYMRENY